MHNTITKLTMLAQTTRVVYKYGSGIVHKYNVTYEIIYMNEYLLGYA